MAQYKHAEQELESELSVCLNNKNDTLAKSCLKRKLLNERLIAAARRKQQALSQECEELRASVTNNEQRLESMRQKRDIFLSEKKEQQFSDTSFNAQFHVSDDEIEVALLKAKQNAVTARSKT